MKKLYVVRDGLKDNGCIVNRNENQIINTNYYLLTYGKGNEGFIKKRFSNNWRLYTQIGEVETIKKMNNDEIKDKSRVRYYHYPTFEKCIEKLQELCGDTVIKICDSKSFPSLYNPNE